MLRRGFHRTVPACPWNRSGFFHGISGFVHLNVLDFPWKVSDYPKVYLESCPNSVDFPWILVRVPGKASTAGSKCRKP